MKTPAPFTSFRNQATTSRLRLATFALSRCRPHRNDQSGPEQRRTSGQSWLTTGAWSNNAAPSPMNDYISGPGMVVALYPTTATSTASTATVSPSTALNSI